MTTDKWWQLIGIREKKATGNKLPTGFCSFMVSLHSCPSSSGSIERIFSSFGLVWSKMRNSLGTDRAEKLVKIYRHLKNKNVEGETESEW
jgi:hypothetical protein